MMWMSINYLKSFLHRHPPQSSNVIILENSILAPNNIQVDGKVFEFLNKKPIGGKECQMKMFGITSRWKFIFAREHEHTCIGESWSVAAHLIAHLNYKHPHHHQKERKTKKQSHKAQFENASTWLKLIQRSIDTTTHS